MGAILAGAALLALLVGGGWACMEIVRLLREIAAELKHIRKHLQDVSTEIGKVSGPLADVKKIYGLGERILGREPKG